MQILKIKDHDNESGMSKEEALALLKKGTKILTNNELDQIVMSDTLRKQYYVFLPAWSGTYIEYKGTKCTVKERGKTYHFTMPEKDGWYETNKLGLPFGKPSSSDNPNARYLWRISEYKGLVSRVYDGWFGCGRRFVYCYGGIARLGVLAIDGKGKVETSKGYENCKQLAQENKKLKATLEKIGKLAGGLFDA